MSLYNDPVKDAIVQIRVSMLFDQPFFGSLAVRLEPVDATKWCETAATDGRHFFYNRDFMKNLSPEELRFVFGHEVLHCALDHLYRRGNREPTIWNMAIDFVTNYILVKQKIGVMPKAGCYSEKFTDDMAAEEIYNLLMDMAKKSAMSEFSKMKPIDMHMDGEAEGKGEGSEKGEKEKKGKGKGKDKGEESDEDGEGDKSDDGDGEIKSDKINPGDETGVDYSSAPPVYSDEDLQKIRTEVMAAVFTSVQSNQGNAPACIKRLLLELGKPKITWRELLESTIKGSMKSDFTFMRPNRRSHYLGVILPHYDTEEMIDICISLDTSGSIGDDKFRDFLTEVQGIIEQYSEYRLHIWCIDAAIYNYKVFTPENCDEICEYQPAGGGGNDFPLNWKFMKENDLEPELFVVFSDGYPCGSWGDPNYCDTIFVIDNQWDKDIKAPFGMTVYMEK